MPRSATPPSCLLPAAGQGTTKIVDANLPISKLREAIPSYDAEERDYLIRTIAFEASGEPEEGKAAFAMPLPFKPEHAEVAGEVY